MNITQVKVTKLTDSKTLAFASITFDECFVVTGLKVLNGKNGLWVAMPNRKKDEEYIDTAFPITKEFRQTVIDAVLNEYNKGGHTGADFARNERDNRQQDKRDINNVIDDESLELPF